MYAFKGLPLRGKFKTVFGVYKAVAPYGAKYIAFISQSLAKAVALTGQIRYFYFVVAS